MKYLWYVLALCATAAVAQECLPAKDRVDCHPDGGATEERCLARGCNWCQSQPREPHCFFPPSYGYVMVGEPIDIGNGVQIHLQRNTDITLFGGDALNLTLNIEYQSDYRLRIKVSDNSPRWEVPLEILPPATGPTMDKMYEVSFTNSPVFSFKVVRKSSREVLFDTSLGGFTFADQFISLGIKLPTKNLYGLGENEQKSFRHNFEEWVRWPMWANGQGPAYTNNIYGVQPHYTVLESDGSAHAVAIVNSNAQEFEVTPAPGLVYRTIGGILDIYIFLGPTPEDTVKQYTEAVGRYPIPPYWALGFQLCRYGYNTLENMRTVVDRMIASKIPYDVQYGDIDIMDRGYDFTIHPVNFAGLPEYVNGLKKQGIKFMTILDPCIGIGLPKGTYPPFEVGNEMDVWVKDPDGAPYVGRMWPESDVHFPDYSKNSTREWWIRFIKEFHEVLAFDALWIDMNEPNSFFNGRRDGCPANNINTPPYIPHLNPPSLFHQTLCPDNVDSAGLQYNTHNLYGWFESEPTIAAATAAVGKRTFALSRSTYLGSGRWVTHWLGDNYSLWSNLHYSIIGILQFNLFGMPFVGPDICGHNNVPSAELCARWMELGAFFPFARNHNGNGLPDQDPAAFDGAIIEASKKALEVRYTLLPYLYSLLAEHNQFGSTVARALWHEFPTDQNTHGIDRQFMLGAWLLITPVLDEGHVTVEGYFPDARFYNYYDGAEVPTRGNVLELNAPMDFINVHVRGGSILPTQEPAVNTVLARENPMGLIVAMDDNMEARGKLYYDAGENLEPFVTGEYFLARFSAKEGKISSTILFNGYDGMGSKVIGTVRVLGTRGDVRGILVNGVEHADFNVNNNTFELFIFRLSLNPTVPFNIEILQ